MALIGLMSFAAGAAGGAYLRGLLSVTPDALRRELGNEKREKRRCQEGAREAAQKLRDLAEELDEKRQQVQIMKEVIAGNLWPEILDGEVG